MASPPCGSPRRVAVPGGSEVFMPSKCKPGHPSQGSGHVIQHAVASLAQKLQEQTW